MVIIVQSHVPSLLSSMSLWLTKSTTVGPIGNIGPVWKAVKIGKVRLKFISSTGSFLDTSGSFLWATVLSMSESVWSSQKWTSRRRSCGLCRNGSSRKILNSVNALQMQKWSKNLARVGNFHLVARGKKPPHSSHGVRPWQGRCASAMLPL